MLKGTVPPDFRLQAFFIDQFPQAPNYTIRAVSNLPPVSLTPVAILRCTLTCEYLSEIFKKIEMTLVLVSGAWGKIHEKNLKQKSRDTVPLKVFWVRINFNTHIQHLPHADLDLGPDIGSQINPDPRRTLIFRINCKSVKGS